MSTSNVNALMLKISPVHRKAPPDFQRARDFHIAPDRRLRGYEGCIAARRNHDRAGNVGFQSVIRYILHPMAHPNVTVESFQDLGGELRPLIERSQLACQRKNSPG